VASDKSDKSKGNPYAKILQIGYGVLNPVSDTLTSKNYDGSDTTWFDKVREATTRSFSANTFEGTGPFIGIVLRDEGLTTINGVVDPSSWVAGPFAHRIVKDDDEAEDAGGIDRSKLAQLPGLRQLRVRIPEIHASLPIPPDLPKRNESANDRQKEAHQIINLYPVFIAQNAAISSTEIKPGSLVWVDFQNKNTLTGGIFLSELDPKPVVEETSGRSRSARAALSSEECIDRGGSEEECSIYTASDVDYTSGGSTSDLELSIAKPLIVQGSGFPYEVIDTFSQSLSIRSKLHTHPKYGTMVSKVRGSGLNSKRPFFWCYGVPESSQLERPIGSAESCHKLIIPRFTALLDMWDVYRNSVLNASSGTAVGAASGDVTYRQMNGNDYKRKNWSSRTYTRTMDVTSGYRRPGGGGSFLEAEKIKDWMITTLQTKGYKSLSDGVRKRALFGAHTAGLAIDLGGNGVAEPGATIHGFDKTTLSAYKKQFKSDAIAPNNKNWIPQYASGFYIFMLKYAWLFGFNNYKAEPWHWELRVPRQAWKNVEEYSFFAGDKNPYYDAYYNSKKIITSLGEFRSLQASDIMNTGTIITDPKLAAIYNAELMQMFYTEQKFPYAISVEERAKSGVYAGKDMDFFGRYGTQHIVEEYLGQLGKSTRLGSYKANSKTIEEIRGLPTSFSFRVPWFASK
jgi:hypothetical protein